jgi:4-amino-4-deoxy-L-arabinose transferase-like glycosyltransferase
MIPLSWLAALLVFRWSKDLYGDLAGLAACTLYCFNPSVLAHAALVTTDVGTTTAMLWASWLWWRFCRKPSIGRWGWVCVALTAAHLCKFTAVLLWPMMLAMAVPFARRGGNRWITYLVAWAAAIPAMVILINASYGFIDCFRPIGSFDFLSSLMLGVQHHLPPGFRVPLPGVMVEGFDAQKFDTQLGYPAFLFGEIYDGARWYYYPLALLCKTPVGLLALMLAAGIALPFKLPHQEPNDYASPLSMALGGIIFLAGVLVIGDVNIGTRYILPALPFALIAISRLWAFPLQNLKHLARLRDGLLILAVAEALFVAPYFISFINFAWGGPSNGSKLLSNSDFDWGEGLIALRDWMHDHTVDKISLLYFGYIDPTLYGVNYQVPEVLPPEDYVAISSFYLQGLGNRIVVSPRLRRPVEILYSSELQERKPVAVVADSIFIYNKDDVLGAALEYAAKHPSPRR